ncbi:MAG: hypothetical protein ACK5Z5_00005, partial [Neisseriaceae bacterium]
MFPGAGQLSKSTGIITTVGSNKSNISNELIRLLNSDNTREVDLAKELIKELIKYKISRLPFWNPTSKEEGTRKFNEIINFKRAKHNVECELEGKNLIFLASNQVGGGGIPVAIPNRLKFLLCGRKYVPNIDISQAEKLDRKVRLRIYYAINSLIKTDSKEQNKENIKKYLQSNDILEHYNDLENEIPLINYSADDNDTFVSPTLSIAESSSSETQIKSGEINHNNISDLNKQLFDENNYYRYISSTMYLVTINEANIREYCNKFEQL